MVEGHADDSDYTVAADGEVSFRIQVGLRSVLLNPMKHEDALRQFMEGQNDGNAQQREIDGILKRILDEKIRECKKALVTFEDECIEGRMVRRLYESELSIAQVAHGRFNGQYL